MNIATGLDISASVGRDEEWLERVGTARGWPPKPSPKPPYWAAMAGSGRCLRLDSQRCPLVVDWSVIGTLEEAADRPTLEATPLIDFEHDIGLRHQDQSIGEDRLIDLSEAIECGRSLLADAPFRAQRSVLNIVGDGVDNFGEDPDAARDRAVAAGITVNGVVINGNPDVVSHYRDHVIGGDAAFVMDIADPATVVDAMTKKFLLDVASAVR